MRTSRRSGTRRCNLAPLRAAHLNRIFQISRNLQSIQVKIVCDDIEGWSVNTFLEPISTKLLPLFLDMYIGIAYFA